MFICDHNANFRDGYENAKKVTAKHPEIDAIFAVKDLVTIWIIKYSNKTRIL